METLDLPVCWEKIGTFEDILYHKSGGIAKITMNRPHVHNAFTPNTVNEMLFALADAKNDERVGVIILTGAGEKAFCSGGIKKFEETLGIKQKKG